MDIISNMPLDKVILSNKLKKRKNRKTSSNSPKNKKEDAILKLALLDIKKRKTSGYKKNNSKQANKKNIASPICSLTNVLINKAIEKVKETKKEKNKEDKIIYSTKEDRQIITNGGYGTVSKAYGAAPVVKYVNYDKLFNHLGIFKAKGMYEDLGTRETDIKQTTESTREMVSNETMEKAAKHFKYFVVGEITGDIGYVPPVGIGVSSKDWEKYRLMSKMSVYQPIIKLKSGTV